jgi:hypothetical protein
MVVYERPKVGSHDECLPGPPATHAFAVLLR